MKINVADYRSQCFEEVHELLSRIEIKLLDLRVEAIDLDRIHSLFRDVHTIKGSSLVVGLNSIAEFAHELETILDKVRNQEVPLTQDLLNLFFQSVDGLRELMNSEIANQPPPDEVKRTVDGLKQFLKSGSKSATPVEAASPKTELSEPVESIEPNPEPTPEIEIEYRIAFVPSGRILSEGIEPLHLFDAVGSLGQMKQVALFTRQLPPLESMQPEEAYFYWYHILLCSKPVAELQRVFSKLTPAHHVCIEAKGANSAGGPSFTGRDAALAAYLLNAGSITPETLAEAEQCQRQCRVPLANLALRDGKIDASQFKAITKEIRNRGISFASGALLIANLRSDDVVALKAWQENLVPTLSECLSALCLIDPAVLAAAETQVASMPDPVAVKVPEPVVAPEPAPVVKQHSVSLSRSSLSLEKLQGTKKPSVELPRASMSVEKIPAAKQPSVELPRAAKSVEKTQPVKSPSVERPRAAKSVAKMAPPPVVEPVPEEVISGEALPPTELMLENVGMMPEFITEIQDHLNTADQLLLTLEKEPARRDTLDALYRAFHTVKGASGFFGLADMQGLAHEAESLLNDARDGKLTLTGRMADFAFGSVDGLIRQVELLRVWMTHQGPLPRDSRSLQLIAELKRLRAGGMIDSAPIPTPPVAPARQPSSPPDIQESTEGFEMFDEVEEPKPVEVVKPAEISKPVPVAEVKPAPEVTEPKPKMERTVAPTPTPHAGPVVAPTERETIRVDCERLDKLINMIGELVISSSMVEQEVLAVNDGTSDFRALTQMNNIVRDLQELSLGMRMVPIAGTFRKMERIVRDLARKLNKKVQFVSEGEETELDKTVVDQIGDPLMHMVRNSVDHGIELPDVRVANGKNEQGTVRLRSFHQGGNIYIELTDDGKGLDRKAIYRKAVERGIISDGTVLTDAEICAFIFHPGFSTAKEVTDVSGRGVGMDVVRRNVEALQGSVTIRSEQGQGSTMAIRLPLTLAILDGLCVSLNEEVFVLPLLSVVESFQPGSSEVRQIAGRTEVILVRGELVPLLRLYRIFQTQARCIDPTQGLVVIVEDQGKKCALLVDELLGQSQVVIKNLEKNFAKVEGIAGATIMGNGRVGLILDIYGLTRMAGRSVTDLTAQDMSPPAMVPLEGVEA